MDRQTPGLSAHRRHDERQAQIDRQIIEGYRRVPPGAPDEWGGVGPGDAATSAMLQHLDAEERDVGFGPWEP